MQKVKIETFHDRIKGVFGNKDIDSENLKDKN